MANKYLLEALNLEVTNMNEASKSAIRSLESMHSNIALTHGYIGNIYNTGPIARRDDRYWYIWCKSKDVRNWYIRYDPLFYGCEPFWHKDMSFPLGKTDECDKTLAKAFNDGTLMKWIDEKLQRTKNYEETLEKITDEDIIRDFYVDPKD